MYLQHRVNTDRVETFIRKLCNYVLIFRLVDELKCYIVHRYKVTVWRPKTIPFFFRLFTFTALFFVFVINIVQCFSSRTNHARIVCAYDCDQVKTVRTHAHAICYLICFFFLCYVQFAEHTQKTRTKYRKQRQQTASSSN